METLALVLLLGLLDRLSGDTMDLLGIDTSNYRYKWLGMEFGLSTDRIAYAWAISVLAGYGALFDLEPLVNFDSASFSTEGLLAFFLSVVAFLLSLIDWTTWLIMVGMYIGMGLGWGEPLGAYITDRKMDQNNLEKWQFGIFKRDALLALVFRGFLWGIFIAPAAILDPRLWIVFAAYLFAFPASVILSKKVVHFRDAWPVAESFRGWMAGGIIAAGVAWL